MEVKKRILDNARMAKAMVRMAEEIISLNNGVDDLVVVGIRDKGDKGMYVGERIAKLIEEMENRPIPFGMLDYTLYRDDLTTIAPQPIVRPTKLPEPIDDKVVVLVFHKIRTGRGAQAALNALIDFGRPFKIILATLVDCGQREILPINPNVTGKNIPLKKDEKIRVRLEETDGEDEVLVLQK